MKRWIFILFVTQLVVTKAQHGFLNASDFLVDSLDSKFAVNFYGEGYINSNSISTMVFNKAYQGESFEGDIKTNIFENLKSENRIIADVYGGGMFYVFDEAKNRIFTVGYEQRNFTVSTFNEDFAKLVLNGNQPYQEQTLDFGGLNYQNQSYQAFKVGFVKKYNTPGLAFGINAGLVRGLSFQSVNIKKGEFYTALDGELVELDVEGTIIQPSSSGGNLGLEMDLYFEKYLNKTNKIAFKINDLGFIKWKNLTSYKADDLYSFEGIVIEDLFNIDTTSFDDLKNKSNAQEILGLTKETSSTSQLLPTLIQLDYTHYFSKRFHIATGLIYQVAAGTYPAINTEADFTLPIGITLLGELDYGGFGYLNYALGAKVSLLKNKLFVLGKFYMLESLVASRGTSGEGANLFVQYLF